MATRRPDQEAQDDPSTAGAGRWGPGAREPSPPDEGPHGDTAIDRDLEELRKQGAGRREDEGGGDAEAEQRDVDRTSPSPSGRQSTTDE
jgi:hypothetical protein